MVKKLGLHRVIDSFFANYKLAVTKNIRSFIIPISSQTLPLVKSFYKANLLYSYTIDHFKNSIIVFPRPTPYIKTFQVMYTAHKSIISISQLQKYQNIGYEFLIFSPFNRGKFITSTEFTYLTVPGFLLAIWLQASEKNYYCIFYLVKFMPARDCFFRPKLFFFNFVVANPNIENFSKFYSSNFFPIQFISSLLFKSENKYFFFFGNKQLANSFQGFLKFLQFKAFLPSYAILHLKGIGYKCYYSKNDGKLIFNTGFNHYSTFYIPKGIEIRLRKVFFIFFSTILNVKPFINIVRSIRFPDPYRAKGFRYKNQFIKFKVGKQRLYFT